MWNIFGRLLFFALIVVQSLFLASYLAKYEDTDGGYAVSILFLPAALGFWWWLNSTQTDLGYALVFGALYVWLGFVPSIGIVFGRIGDKIESKGFWNPSTLKMTLCVTPLLLMIAFHTAVASKDINFKQVTGCLLKAVINLYDGIELLGVILDENECSHGISNKFKNTVIAFACLSYLGLPVVIWLDWANSFKDEPLAHRAEEQDKPFWAMYYGLQAVCEAIFLGLRLGLSLGYGISASIFINKNIFLFIVHIRQIFSLCCGIDEASPASREASTSASPVHQSTRVAPQPTQVTEVLPSAPPPYNPDITD